MIEIALGKSPNLVAFFRFLLVSATKGDQCKNFYQWELLIKTKVYYDYNKIKILMFSVGTNVVNSCWFRKSVFKN